MAAVELFRGKTSIAITHLTDNQARQLAEKLWKLTKKDDTITVVLIPTGTE